MRNCWRCKDAITISIRASMVWKRTSSCRRVRATRLKRKLVVEAGKILERGKHAELLALQGRYHDLYTRQHGLEENLFLSPGEGDKVEEKGGGPRGGSGGVPDAVSLIRGQGF